MKITIWTKFSLLILMLAAKISFGQSQMEMTMASAEAVKTDKKKMEMVLRLIHTRYSNDSLFLKNLDHAQALWTKYYQAEIATMYPDYSDRYGSMKSMCVTGYARNLINTRIRFLERWLIGKQQGDCSSSLKETSDLPPYKSSVPTEPAH